MAQSNEWYLNSKSCAGAQAQPAKLARMAASELTSDAAIRFKLGRRATDGTAPKFKSDGRIRY
ncbi:hypothetical protein PCASD_02109 [Puccinia coronata f. sp. avenae]|uniref:Uncharacterized protein n=1 Tax=Puccinia coronata f. sp. avenae TaxID=200324 RepID=A0A2N5VQ77_9BASI|nr:hypothetical protein PCASD_02109 [Puccinia coronata f. sp. avenae]